MESMPIFVSFRRPECVSDYVTIRYTNQHGLQSCDVEIIRGDDILAVLVRIVGGARAREVKEMLQNGGLAHLSSGVRKGDIIEIH